MMNMQYAVISVENGTLGTFATLEAAEACAEAHYNAAQENGYPTIFKSINVDSTRDMPFQTIGDLRQLLEALPDTLPIHFQMPDGTMVQGVFGVIGDDGPDAPAFAVLAS